MLDFQAPQIFQQKNRPLRPKVNSAVKKAHHSVSVCDFVILSLLVNMITSSQSEVTDAPYFLFDFFVESL